MSERKEFWHILKTKTSDSIVLVITFLLTVFTDLTTAVEVGLIFAVILFVKRMSELLTVAKVLPDPADQSVKEDMVDGHDCPQINIYNIEGPLFFGAAEHFEMSIMETIKYKPKILLLRMGRVPYMDTTGESNLSTIVKHFHKLGGVVLVSEIQSQPKDVLKRTQLYERIGEKHFFQHTGDAINFALQLVESSKCRGCKQFAFQECACLSDPHVTAGKRVIRTS